MLVYDGKDFFTCPVKARNLSGRTGRGDTTFGAYLAKRMTGSPCGGGSALRYRSGFPEDGSARPALRIRGRHPEVYRRILRLISYEFDHHFSQKTLKSQRERLNPLSFTCKYSYHYGSTLYCRRDGGNG